MSGVFHGARLAEMDARHGGSIIDAQMARASPTPRGSPVCWPTWPRCGLRTSRSPASRERDIDVSLDLLAIAVRP